MSSREKNCIPELLNLFTCADRSMNTIFFLHKEYIKKKSTPKKLCQVSHFMCNMLPLTYLMSLMPTAQARDPPHDNPLYCICIMTRGGIYGEI